MISEVDFEQNTDEHTSEAIFDLGDGWQLSLDRREIVPEDPGRGSPALVQSEEAFLGVASFYAAKLEGEVVGAAGDNVPLPEDVLEKLDELEEVVENFIKFGVSSPELQTELLAIPRAGAGGSAHERADAMKTAYKQLSEKYPELRCPDVLELCASAFEDCQQDVACVAGSGGLSFEPASNSPTP